MQQAHLLSAGGENAVIGRLADDVCHHLADLVSEILGFEYQAGLCVEFHLDLHLIAGSDTSGWTVGVAQTKEIPAARDGERLFQMGPFRAMDRVGAGG